MAPSGPTDIAPWEFLRGWLWAVNLQRDSSCVLERGRPGSVNPRAKISSAPRSPPRMGSCSVGNAAVHLEKMIPQALATFCAQAPEQRQQNQPENAWFSLRNHLQLGARVCELAKELPEPPALARLSCVNPASSAGSLQPIFEMISLGADVPARAGGVREFVFLITVGYALELPPGSCVQCKLQLEAFQGIKALRAHSVPRRGTYAELPIPPPVGAAGHRGPRRAAVPPLCLPTALRSLQGSRRCWPQLRLNRGLQELCRGCCGLSLAQMLAQERVFLQEIKALRDARWAAASPPWGTRGWGLILPRSPSFNPRPLLFYFVPYFGLLVPKGQAQARLRAEGARGRTYLGAVGQVSFQPRDAGVDGFAALREKKTQEGWPPFSLVSRPSSSPWPGARWASEATGPGGAAGG